MLAVEYPDSRHVADLGLDTATDRAIWDYAGEHRFVIVSKDSDFRQLAFLLGPPPKAIWVNLQQARHIINYDLPWNPMRLVQRHGRIDRVGSPHAEVFIRCVCPTPASTTCSTSQSACTARSNRPQPASGWAKCSPTTEAETSHSPRPEKRSNAFRRQEADLFDPTEQADNILSAIRALGLEPYIPPEPLPEITADDIHLVCWLALV